MVQPAARGTLAANIVLPILAIIAVSLRLYARRLKPIPVKSDDYVIVLALLCAVGVCVGGIYGACTGLFGVQFQLMSPESYERFRKLQFVDILLCHFIYGLIKISVVLFYKRIFVTPRFMLRANCTLAVVAMWMITAFFSVLLCAKGVSTFWTTPPFLDGSEYQLNLPSLLTAMASIDIALDLVILALPIPVIKDLNMTPGRKISLVGIFMLGAFCVVASAVRLWYTHSLLDFIGDDNARRMDLTDKNDVWAHIEACASVVAACLPTLGPLWGEFRTPESIIGSIRSLFSLKSGSVFSVSKAKVSEDKPSLAGAAWLELQTQGANATNISSTFYRDVEAQSSNKILVKSTFTSGNE